jgi:hypothetical protein
MCTNMGKIDTLKGLTSCKILWIGRSPVLITLPVQFSSLELLLVYNKIQNT